MSPASSWPGCGRARRRWRSRGSTSTPSAPWRRWRCSPGGGGHEPRLRGLDPHILLEFDLLFARNLSLLPSFKHHPQRSVICLKSDLSDGCRLAVQLVFDSRLDQEFARTFGVISTGIQSIFQRSKFLPIVAGQTPLQSASANDWKAYAASLEELLSLHETVVEHQALLLEDRHAAVESFLANMSHEIRTPLNAISGLTSVMLETPLSPIQQDHVETIRASGHHLLSIINNVLNYSRIEAGRIERQDSLFDLRICVEDAFDIVANAAELKGLWLTYLIDEDIPGLLVSDAGWIRQILINLLSNAIKFTPEGEIIARVSAEPVSGELFRFCFSVQDSGVGIPRERLDALFQPFSQVDASMTRAFDGAGLGLAICRRLSRLLGGDIRVQSVIGEGSTFSFEVPAECPRRLLSGEHGKPRWDGRCVLVVDPHTPHTEMLRRTTAPWGVAVVGTPAVALAAAALASARFDALFVAQNLVAELQDALETLPATAREIPLIVVSSPSASEPQEPRFSIKRPVRRSSLLSIFSEVFRSTAAPPQASDRGPERGDDVRILIAEDNKINHKVLRLLLLRLGYKNVEVVENGVEAVDSASNAHYDVIFMDVQMPGLNGIEATKKIRSAQRGVEPWIIALTANAFEETRDACLQAGMDDFVTKPLSPDSLKLCLQRATQEATARRLSSGIRAETA
jgi:signal transduction histidine kinase/CheY-like chemotaxis protein